MYRSTFQLQFPGGGTTKKIFEIFCDNEIFHCVLSIQILKPERRSTLQIISGIFKMLHKRWY